MSRDSASDLKLVSAPQDYFRELLMEALSLHRLRPSPETEMYLVELLNRFMATDQLFSRDQEGRYREETLVGLMKEALGQQENRLRTLIFRQVGDLSLYKAGFFHEYLQRRSVDLGYYIEMGGVAYQNAAALSSESTTRSVYEELSHQFPRFVEVLTEISALTTPKTESNLLRFCEQWVETNSEQAAKILREAGISLESIQESVSPNKIRRKKTP